MSDITAYHFTGFGQDESPAWQAVLRLKLEQALQFAETQLEKRPELTEILVWRNGERGPMTVAHRIRGQSELPWN